MKIERKRWIVMRNNRTEVLCGLARDYHFKSVQEIGNTSLKTFRSKKQAESAWLSTPYSYNPSLEVVPVLESVEVLDK